MAALSKGLEKLLGKLLMAAESDGEKAAVRKMVGELAMGASTKNKKRALEAALKDFMPSLEQALLIGTAIDLGLMKSTIVATMKEAESATIRGGFGTMMRGAGNLAKNNPGKLATAGALTVGAGGIFAGKKIWEPGTSTESSVDEVIGNERLARALKPEAEEFFKNNKWKDPAGCVEAFCEEKGKSDDYKISTEKDFKEFKEFAKPWIVKQKREEVVQKREEAQKGRASGSHGKTWYERLGSVIANIFKSDPNKKSSTVGKVLGAVLLGGSGLWLGGGLSFGGIVLALIGALTGALAGGAMGPADTILSSGDPANKAEQKEKMKGVNLDPSKAQTPAVPPPTTVPTLGGTTPGAAPVHGH